MGVLKHPERLKGVDTSLTAVVRAAAGTLPFDLLVVEGVRTKERQAEMVRIKASRTMNSYHLTGHAVDLAPVVDGKPRWDWPLFTPIAKAMKKEAAKRGVALTWGGDWRKFPDGPHFQITRQKAST